VSVIIPCYNAERFLGETISSVLRQTFTDYEIICVNDGSTDRTADVVREFRDPRIRYFEQVNQGVSNARNRGIAEARGRYVAFLDADDVFLADNLRLKVAHFERKPDIGLVYSSEIVFDSDTGNELRRTQGRAGHVLNDLLELRPHLIHSPSGVAVTRDLLLRVGGFDPIASTSADWDLWLRLAVVTPFGFIDEPLVRYRVHADQMHLNIALMEHDTLYILRKARAAGLFQNDRHYRYCAAKVSLVVAASFLKDSRSLYRSATALLRSLMTDPRPFREHLAHRIAHWNVRPG
jgi:glycosyltransferase involved in cell wall biosynthesis